MFVANFCHANANMLVGMYNMYKADVCFAAVLVVGISQAWEWWYHKTIKMKSTRDKRQPVVGRFFRPSSPPSSLSRCQKETQIPKKTKQRRVAHAIRPFPTRTPP